MIADWVASKLFAPLMAGLLLLSLVGLGIQTARINGFHIFGFAIADGLKDKVASLNDEIDNPKTGYLHQLGVERDNEGKLEAAITDRNAQIVAQAADSAKRLHNAEEALKGANARASAIAAKMAVFMATPPQGADGWSRVQDIDQRFVETLQ